MRIAVIGLGLMGASLAMALRGFRDCVLVGSDIDADVCKLAVSKSVVDEAYTETCEAVNNADLVVFCVYPHTLKELIAQNLSSFKDGAIVSDICGVKTVLYENMIKEFPPNVDYIGIHPMAGKEVDGFNNADAFLFKNTGFIITPLESTKTESVELMRSLAQYIGATRVTVSDYRKHDDIIAYTSDLMHISAAALCVDYHPDMTLAYTAGAFRDCTRIANINAGLWTELLLDNAEFTLGHLDKYINNLSIIRESIKIKDNTALYRILETAGINKKELLEK